MQRRNRELIVVARGRLLPVQKELEDTLRLSGSQFFLMMKNSESRIRLISKELFSIAGPEFAYHESPCDDFSVKRINISW